METEKKNSTYSVASANMAWLEDQFAKLNKKAKKIGSEPVGYNVLERIEVPVRDEQFGFETGRFNVEYLIEVYGLSPKLEGGWELLAVLSHEEAGNIVRELPSNDLDLTPYRFSKAFCDHCKTQRARKETVLVRNPEGHVKQVGKRCLKDYLGHSSPERIAFLAQVLGMMGNRDLLLGGGAGGEFTFDLKEYLTYVAASIRHFGWATSKSANSTAHNARMQMRPNKDEQKLLKEKPELNVKLKDEDRTMAVETLEWIRSLIETGKASQNNYLHNLAVIGSKEYVRYKELNFIASAVVAYQKDMEMEINRRKRELSWKEKAERSNFVGEVGKRSEFVAELKEIRSLSAEDGWYGLYKFEDAQGNVMVWFTAKMPEELRIAKGDSIKMKATVKRHDVYRDLKQTILTRCAIQMICFGE